MKSNKIILLVLVLVLSLTSTGCFGVSDEFRSIKNQLMKGMNANYKREIEFSAGKVTLSMAKTVVHFSDDDEAEEMLRHVTGVELGNYKIKDKVKPDYQNLIKIMEQNGWTYIVRSFEKKSYALIFVRIEKNDRIKNMFVINCEGKELTLVKIQGNLERIVEHVIKEKHMDYVMGKNRK